MRVHRLDVPTNPPKPRPSPLLPWLGPPPRSALPSDGQVSDFLNGRWTWADARKLLMPEEAREGSAGGSAHVVRAPHGAAVACADGDLRVPVCGGMVCPVLFGGRGAA